MVMVQISGANVSRCISSTPRHTVRLPRQRPTIPTVDSMIDITNLETSSSRTIIVRRSLSRLTLTTMTRTLATVGSTHGPGSRKRLSWQANGPFQCKSDVLDLRKWSVLRESCEVQEVSKPCCDILDSAGNLVRSQLDNTYFALDSAFPRRLTRATMKSSRVESCVSFLIQDFTRRGLTNQRDKVNAIQGLEIGLKTALCCEVRFGIFQIFLHRNLS